jgi:hypothetical protein
MHSIFQFLLSGSLIFTFLWDACEKNDTIRLNEQANYEVEHGIQPVAPKELADRINQLRRRQG